MAQGLIAQGLKVHWLIAQESDKCRLMDWRLILKAKKNAAWPRFSLFGMDGLSGYTAGQHSHYTVTDCTRACTAEQSADNLLGIN